MITMVISCKRSCVSAGHHAHVASGRGIWEELKSNCDAHAQSGMPAASVVRSAFDFVAVVVAQFGLPISEQVAKIHLHFAVRSCDLCPFHSFCHALDSSASETYGI